MAIMKDSVQGSAEQSYAELCLKRDLNPGPGDDDDEFRFNEASTNP